MFKKVLLVLGLGVVALLLVCGGILFWAQRSGAQAQEKFFAAVGTTDPDQVLALCDPSVREEIDGPVLAAWLKAVHEQLGPFKGLSATDFNTTARATSEGNFIHSEGTVNFEKGTAHSELTFRDGKLVQFEIKSDKISDDWFKQGPSDTSLYRDRGKRFLQAFFAGKADEARSMMHETLQKEVPADKFQEMIAAIAAQDGAIKSIEVKDEAFESDKGQTLTIQYDIVCEKGKVVGETKFEFAGLKGHLLGFNIHRSP